MSQDDLGQAGPRWEREVLEKLASGTLREQRARRRWGIFFKLLGFAYVAVIIAMLAGWWPVADELVHGKHTALVDLRGVISADSEASAEAVTEALRSAFKDKNTAGIVLRVNSPGGSPVQSGIIYDEIIRLRKEHPSTPLYAVIEDICASGGYFVAAAADSIYVNRASVVGSIGVLMDGFGFTGAMEKVGVERRLLTAGENKGFLDPFSPQDERQRAHAQVLLDDIHQQFIAVVRQGRGARLKESPEMFSGLLWTGQKSIELGLSDALGSVDSVARDVIKADRVVDFTVKRSLADQLSKRFGVAVADGVTSQLRALSLPR